MVCVFTDKPKFECKEEVQVYLSQRNVQIRCPVRADPPISNLNFYWQAGDDNETLKSGESEGNYKAQVDSVVGICDATTEILWVQPS